MDMGLSGRTYLVTGASSGVGLATTTMLLGQGANVAACARDHTRLRDSVAEIPGPGALATSRCDVLDQSDVDRFVAEAADRFGAVDGVVNNAGRSLLARWDETTDEQWISEVELKLFGALRPVRAAVPWLRASEAGSVVNVNAILARQPESRLAATSAARSALLNLSRTLADELADDGVRVNSVCLGLIDTGQWRRRYEESGTGEGFSEWSATLAADRGIALGRLGTAEEVAYPIVCLLSPRASYITGATVDVGGGVARYA